MDELAALRQFFGFSAFRAGQQTLIDAVLSGRDALGVMPTGGGKSLCYELPALLLPGLTLVVSPLISLMKDQVMALRNTGIPAGCINSAMSMDELREAYTDARYGAYKLLYVAPERLLTDGFCALAQELDLPVIVHDRDAHADSLAIVREFPHVRGVFHCYSGSVETAQELLKRGWYLGFDGPLTYKNAKKTVEVAKIVPLDRVLLETDSPYMAPVPVRGTRNDSRNVLHIAAKFAEVRGMETDEVIALTNENGRRLFGIR